MKNLFFILFFSFSIPVNAQQGINFIDGSFSEIMNLSKAENKPVFYMFYATWCGHCNKMKKEILTDLNLGTFFNNSFICAWQDMEQGEGPDLLKKFNVKSFPTFVVLNNNGELLYSFSGEFKINDFILEGKNALDTKKQFPFLRAQFLSDITNSENCLNYVAALRKSKLDTSEPTRKYLSTLTEKELITPINWKIIANGVHDIDTREFQYVLKNQKEFAKVSSPTRVEKKIVNIVMESLKPFVEASDTINYLRKRSFAEAIHLVKTDSLIFKYDRIIFENSKNWKSYQKTTAASINLVWENPFELNEIASVYLNNFNDQKALKQAIVWVIHSSKLKESKEVYLLLARLQLKTGDFIAAKESAEKAKNIALQFQWKTNEADEIINQIK